MTCDAKKESHYLDAAAGVVALLDYLYLHGDVGFHLIHMTDYSHMPTALTVKGAKGGDGIGERLSAESAKALVDEECIHRQCVAYVGKGEGKGERHEKTLTATERVGGYTLYRRGLWHSLDTRPQARCRAYLEQL